MECLRLHNTSECMRMFCITQQLAWDTVDSNHIPKRTLPYQRIKKSNFRPFGSKTVSKVAMGNARSHRQFALHSFLSVSEMPLLVGVTRHPHFGCCDDWECSCNS